MYHKSFKFRCHSFHILGVKRRWRNAPLPPPVIQKSPVWIGLRKLANRVNNKLTRKCISYLSLFVSLICASLTCFDSGFAVVNYHALEISSSKSYCCKEHFKIQDDLVLVTDLFEVFVVLYCGDDIIEGCFIALSCIFNFFHDTFNSLPCHTRSVKNVISKNVVAFSTQKPKLPSGIWERATKNWRSPWGWEGSLSCVLSRAITVIEWDTPSLFQAFRLWDRSSLKRRAAPGSASWHSLWNIYLVAIALSYENETRIKKKANRN